MTTKTVKITQIKSAIGRLATHKDCLKGLGLRRMHQTVTVQATDSNMGMINKIYYMLKVEEN
ncbi:MAG: 50S ribosomal protein L30 [Methylococcaceae bacterium]